MSADNYVGVLQQKDGKYGLIPYGNMSMLDEDCQYRGHVEKTYDTRADALVAAHDRSQDIDIVEYGVIELHEPPEKPCGRCYMCVNDRECIATDITRCDACGEPISDGEWQVHTQGGTFHNRCEPNRNQVKEV